MLWVFLVFLLPVAFAGTQCTTDEDMGEICLSITKSTDDCHFEVLLEVNGEQQLEQTTMLQSLVATARPICIDQETCTLCYEWQVSVDNHGGATGSAFLSGSCTASADPIFIGEYTMENLYLCSIPCPNACTGHGKCQSTGVCDCGPGYYGLDCSSTNHCNSTTTTAEKILEISTSKQLEAEESVLMYAVGYEPLAEFQLLVNVTEGNLKSILEMKSCHPQKENNFYDAKYDYVNGNFSISLSTDCNRVFGGVWFFLITCNDTGPCRFLIETNGYVEERITPLQLDDPQLISLDEWTKYYSIDLMEISGSNTSKLHFDLTTNGIDCAIESVALLPLSCPTNELSFVQLTIPMQVVRDEAICKYNASLQEAQVGEWYIAIKSSELTDMPMWISVSTGNCNSFCIHGYCDSNNVCSCFPGWSGDFCDFDSKTTEKTNNDDIPLPQLVISIIALALIGIVLMILIGLVAKYLAKKKKNNQPADNLFTMLAQEQDLDTL